jgi:hypothetical protein
LARLLRSHDLLPEQTFCLDTTPNYSFQSMRRFKAVGHIKYLNSLASPNPFGRAISLYLSMNERIGFLTWQPQKLASNQILSTAGAI